SGNKIYVDPNIADTFPRDFIWFHTNYPTPLYVYDNATITNNTLYYNGVRLPFSIYLAAAKGVNWTESNNVKTAYVAPPAVPNPLGLPSPVSVYQFNETTGNTAGDLVRGASGNGTLTNFGGTQWVAGKIGNALQFDGTNDYVLAPNAISTGATSFT